MQYNDTVMRCSRQMFVNALFSADHKADAFARTFLRKADMQNLWEHCKAIVDAEGNVCAAIATTYSKKEPRVANLQLLHTFSKYRRMGYAEFLCQLSIVDAVTDGCSYYRVSAEPAAVAFYKRIGFTFLGEQKSKCQLSMFRLADNEADLNDPIIAAAVYKKGKGGCVKIFNNE